MGSRVSALLGGIMLGIIVGFAGSYALGQRYTITKDNEALQIKMDRWTGKTWIMRYYKDDNSKYISSFYWEQVGQKP